MKTTEVENSVRITGIDLCSWLLVTDKQSEATTSRDMHGNRSGYCNIFLEKRNAMSTGRPSM